MKKEYTPEQRRNLAKRLRDIYKVLESGDFDALGVSDNILDEMLFDLDEAIVLISPEFFEEENAALEAALNSPEMDAIMKEARADPGYQQGLEEFKKLAENNRQ